MCDSVHIALCSPMFAKSLPVQLLSLQIKRQLRKGVPPVQSEVGERCLESSRTKPSPKSATLYPGPAGPAGEQHGFPPAWGAAPLPPGHMWRPSSTRCSHSAHSLPSLLCWGAGEGKFSQTPLLMEMSPEVPVSYQYKLCQLRAVHRSCKFILQ